VMGVLSYRGRAMVMLTPLWLYVVEVCGWELLTLGLGVPFFLSEPTVGHLIT